MYHWIVRQKVRRSFRQLSAGDCDTVLRQFAADAVLSFSGRHSLSGEHRGAATVRQWFERLYRIFPGIRFEVLDVLSTGWPWNTVAATHFSVHVKRRDGQLYHNQGMQYLRLRWGKVVEDRIYEDTQKLAAELQQMAQQGVSEALCAPLASAQ
jgi:ketosteroid isomerase-like protein